MAAFQSSYAMSGAPDTQVTLASPQLGSITTTLAVDIQDVYSEELQVEDAAGAPVTGVIAIEDELIIYSGRMETDRLLDLYRGAFGTNPASHTLGVPVYIYGQPVALNPAIPTAIIAVETSIINFADDSLAVSLAIGGL